jgi:tetratricopeptide (TPR) repeat protein
VTRLLLNESRRGPLILVFEDLHWIDTETRHVLDALVNLLPATRILLIVTYRPEFEHRWGNRDHYSQFRIRPLSRDGADDLLTRLVGEDASLKRLKQKLIERTEGNPFFLEETVRSLIDSGKLLGTTGNLRQAEPLENVSIPASVQAVLASRIDRLPTHAKRLLQAAAVIGKDVPLSILEAIMGKMNEELRSSIQWLHQSEFLYEKSFFPELEYTFKHSLTHEVAYAELLQAQRKILHAAVVVAIERIYPHHLAQHVEDLARHALRGEVWDKAAQYLRQAGMQAARRSAHHEALAFFNDALSALHKLPADKEYLEQSIELHFAARNSLWPFSDHTKIFYHLQEAETLAKILDDQRTLGRIASFMIQHHRMAGSPHSALQSAERALAVARELGDFELEVDTNFRAALTCLSLGEYDRAEHFFTENLNALNSGRSYDRPGQPGHPSVLSRTWLAICLAERGRFENAIAYATEAIAIAEKLKDVYSLASALFGSGAVLLHRHEVYFAEQTLEKAAGLCRQYDIPVLERLVMSELGHAKTLQGRLSEAIPLLERAADIDRGSATTGRLALFLVRLGEAYLSAGRLVDASGVCGKALELSQRRSERGHEAWGWRLDAEIKSRSSSEGHYAAISSYCSACSLSEALGMWPLTALATLGRSKAFERVGRAAEAQRDLVAARRCLAKLKMKVSSDMQGLAPIE